MPKSDGDPAAAVVDRRARGGDTTLGGREEAGLALSARRRRGRRVLALTLAASIATAALAFWAGTAVHGGAGALPRNVGEPPATVPVGREVLLDGVEGTGTVALTAGVPVAALAPRLSAPGAQPVVTGFPWHVGSRAHDGDVLVEVAGEPIFLLSGATPAYRDLQVGDHGKDVAELQGALAAAGFPVSDPEGTFGASTAAAVAALYRAHGYTAPTGHTSSKTGGTRSGSAGAGTPTKSAMLPVWSAVYVESLPATVSAVHSAVGGQLSAGGALLDLTTGAPVADISVEPSIPATLRPGMAVRLTTGEGVRVWGRVVSASAPSGGSSSPSGEGASASSPEGSGRSASPGRGGSSASGEGGSTSTTEGSPAASESPSVFGGATVVVGLPRGGAGLALGAPVSALIVRASSRRPVLVAPISAVQTAADGSDYVAVEREGRQVRVGVVQGLTAAGNVALRPLPGSVLRAGERVVVPN